MPATAAWRSVCQTWALERGLALYAPDGYRSQTVTTVDNQLGIEVGDLNRFLLQRGMRLANGYGVLKGKTFRIAHMGKTQMSDIDTLLTALDEYLTSLKG